MHGGGGFSGGWQTILSPLADPVGELLSRAEVCMWSEEDVAGLWLPLVGFGEYADAFRAGRVNGEVLLTMQDADLAPDPGGGIGIKHRLHRRRLLLEVEKLRAYYRR